MKYVTEFHLERSEEEEQCPFTSTNNISDCQALRHCHSRPKMTGEDNE
jgi:hypothetical protein